MGVWKAISDQWGDGMRLMVSTTEGPEGQCTSELQKGRLTLEGQVVTSTWKVRSNLLLQRVWKDDPYRGPERTIRFRSSGGNIHSRTPEGPNRPSRFDVTIHSRRRSRKWRSFGRNHELQNSRKDQSLWKVRRDDPFQKFRNNLQLQKFKKGELLQNSRRDEIPKKV